MADLFEDDDNEKSREGQETVERSRKQAAGETEVELAAPKTDDDDDDDEPAKPDGAWKAKKRERRENFQALKADLDRERAARAAAEQRSLEYQNYLQHQRQQEQQPKADPDADYDKHALTLQNDWNSSYQYYSMLEKQGKLTPELQAEYNRKVLEFKKRELKLNTDYQKASQPQQQQPQQQMSAADYYVNAQYPDILSDERARNWGLARLRQHVLEGETYNKELIDHVASETRAQFKLGGQQTRPEPRSAPRGNRERYVGQGTGPRGNPDAPVTKITMTKQDRRMALAVTSHLAGKKSEEERIRLWAEGPGKQAAELNRKERA